jgi:hypothetical protein
MSSPVNRTALREEENRSAPPSQQVSANAVTGPTPYSRAARTFRAGQVPGRGQHLFAQRLHAGLEGGEHVHGGGDLHLPVILLSDGEVPSSSITGPESSTVIGPSGCAWLSMPGSS